MQEKIFNKKFGLIFDAIVVVTGTIMVTGLNKGVPATAESLTNWDAKPIVVNVQVDLEREGDQATVDSILNEIEKYNGHATVFVTGELASLYLDVIRNIENREHQIAVHGWQKGEDLTSLSFKEQLGLIQRSFAVVKNAVQTPDNVLDFKPQGYKFNDDTIRILQEIGARSISGLFSCEESFCKCWYAQQLGKITFPYPITNEFWAIPISEIKIDSKDTPLDDEYIDNPQYFLNYLLEKYNRQTETKDPLIIVVHPSITGADEAKLTALTQFLDYVKQNNGKIASLDSIRHFTSYITNFDATGPSSASAGEEVIITTNYTSNIWCPYYRFLMYGKYPGQEWQLIDGSKYCEFVYTGPHTFTRKLTIPEPPANETTYTLRAVGRATYGGCSPIGDLQYWPNAENYDVMKEVEIEVESNCIPVPNRTTGNPQERINLLFVPDDDYNGDIVRFLQDVNNLIDNNFGAISPIPENLENFNFYHTELEGDANTHPHTIPEDLNCKFDAVAILHVNSFSDWTDHGLTIFSAEGDDSQHSFIHESGHSLFKLADEYTDSPPGCTDYLLGGLYPDIFYPNIWSSQTECENDAKEEGWDVILCNNFCPSSNSCCGTGWWRIDRTSSECNDLNDCDEVMIDNDNGFGIACQRRINYVFDQLPGMIDIRPIAK